MSQLVANGTYFGRTVLVRHCAGLALAETQYAAGTVVPAHEHETALCVLVLEGTFEEYGAREHTCLPGSLVFLPAGAAHSHRFLAPRSRAFTVQFGAEWTTRLSECDVRVPTRGHTVARGRGSWSAARLYEEFRTSNAPSALVLDERAIETLATLANAPPTTGNEQRARWLRVARDYIDAHFRESFALADLARLTGVHPAYLSRAFRRHTGETLSGRVRRLRLEHASERLARDRAAIGMIGIDAGFADHSHFTREFKRATGTTPQAYRDLFSPA